MMGIPTIEELSDVTGRGEDALRKQAAAVESALQDDGDSSNTE